MEWEDRVVGPKPHRQVMLSAGMQNPGFEIQKQCNFYFAQSCEDLSGFFQHIEPTHTISRQRISETNGIRKR